MNKQLKKIWKDSPQVAADKKLLNDNYGVTLSYKGTMFKFDTLSSNGGFYMTALATTKHCEKGAAQWLNRATALRLIRKNSEQTGGI